MGVKIWNEIWNFEISNIKIMKIELFDFFIFKFIFYSYVRSNRSNTPNTYMITYEIKIFWNFKSFTNCQF